MKKKRKQQNLGLLRDLCGLLEVVSSL